jgi:hypothetical protein
LIPQEENVKESYTAVLRIRDVYPGSAFFPIPDPGSSTLISDTILEKFKC